MVSKEDIIFPATAGYLEQDRRDAAARDGGTVDGDQKDDGRNGLHAVGEGQAQSHDGCELGLCARSESGTGPSDGADRPRR